MGRLFSSVVVSLLALASTVQGQIPISTAQTVMDGQPIDIGVRLVAQGLNSPVFLAAPPDGSGRLFVVDQIGVITILNRDGTQAAQPFLDVRDRMVRLTPGYDERGLLGLAFHPDYARSGRFFVYYNAPLRGGGPVGSDSTLHLSEFHVSKDDPSKADPQSERVVLQIDKPYPNHNGGSALFGPDGLLYLSIGDGGGANDVGLGHVPGGNGQAPSALLGKILRIDVDHGSPYAIPPDNPFAGGKGAPEVYAYGLRNPYRMSFDRGGTHELFAGDVGQNLFEEVDIVSRGSNYGWNIREGLHCFDPGAPNTPPATCPSTGKAGEPLTDPILEYGHDIGTAIIGGYVYRGQAIPAMAGKYVFGDFTRPGTTSAGVLLAASQPQSGGRWALAQLRVYGSLDGQLDHAVLGFGEDAVGELYVLTRDSYGPTGQAGRVFQIVTTR
jgi:glucose/arabinose dehydrogenase